MRRSVLSKRTPTGTFAGAHTRNWQACSPKYAAPIVSLALFAFTFFSEHRCVAKEQIGALDPNARADLPSVLSS
jgi:hypothetical protein